MLKCKSCGREYEDEASLVLSSDDSGADDGRVFDGRDMRTTCLACGGMVFPVEDHAPADEELAA
jgi:uncharacterized OB-fold protein